MPHASVSKQEKFDTNENERSHTHHSGAFCNGIIRDQTEQHAETGCGRTSEPEAPVTRENRRAVSCYRGLSWKTFQPHKLPGKCGCSEVCKVLQRTSRFWGRRVVPSANFGTVLSTRYSCRYFPPTKRIFAARNARKTCLEQAFAPFAERLTTFPPSHDKVCLAGPLS